MWRKVESTWYPYWYTSTWADCGVYCDYWGNIMRIRRYADKSRRGFYQWESSGEMPVLTPHKNDVWSL